jgi:hypothetical protein
MVVAALGLVNWFATLLVVESEFFRPVRDWIHGRSLNAKRAFTSWAWWKIDFMINCHMCAGTWVAMLLVPLAPLIFGPGIVPYIAVGLLIKAIGHIILVLHKLGEAYTQELGHRQQRREFTDQFEEARQRRSEYTRG